MYLLAASRSLSSSPPLFLSLSLALPLWLTLSTIPSSIAGGNYKTGVAFGDCVQYGCDVATEVTKFLTAQDTNEGTAGLEGVTVSDSSKVDETVAMSS